MANERKTIVTYKGTGSQKVFAFPFDYLRKSFIKVMIDGNPLTYGTDYTVSDKQLTFTNAPVLNAIIVIYRETATDRLVAWEDASVLRAGDLTLFEVQLLHIAEETKDNVQEAGLALDDLDGKWDARLKVLKNLLDPVDNLDAVNKRYFESTQAGYIQASQAKVDQATAQANFAQSKANDASASASAARTSELNAKTSETNAKTSETNAKASENAAKTSEANAKASENAAKTSETNAANSASQAATSASNAANSATQAYNYMQQASNNAGYTKAQADAKFAPSGFGYEAQAKQLPDGYNLDNLVNSGIYMGKNLTAYGGTWTNPDWWWIEVIRHNDLWVYQRITSFENTYSDSGGRSWHRWKQNGTWQQSEPYRWKDVGACIAILQGTIVHGGTLPLPSGFTQDQCKWIVSPYQDHQVRAWNVYDGDAGADYVHYRSYCYTDANRVVHCGTYIEEIGGMSWSGIANYLVIGVKY